MYVPMAMTLCKPACGRANYDLFKSGGRLSYGHSVSIELLVKIKSFN